MQYHNKLMFHVMKRRKRNEMNEKMTKCSACGSEITKSVETCPKCGAKNKQSATRITIMILIAIVIL